MTEQKTEQKTGDETGNKTENTEDMAADGEKLDQGSSPTNPSADIVSRSLGVTGEGAGSREDEFEKCKKQAEEYLNNWKRERADFINYKKDETKRLEEFVRFANEGLILEVIDILDDLELAAEQMSDGGLGQIVKKFLELLAKYGVERVKVEGKFDPVLQEAIEGEVEGEGEGRVEEVRAGYTMHGRVIRPARVRIKKVTINE